MKELERILRGDHTDAERVLVRSAKLDVPPADGKGRVLAALGVGAGVTTAGAAAAAKGVGVAAKGVAAGLSATTKWVAIGAIGAAAVGGFHALAPHGRWEPLAGPAPSSAQSVSLPSAPPKAAPPAPNPELTRADVTPAPQPLASAASAGSTTAPSLARSSSGMSSGTSGLGAEVEYLDAARRALAKSDPEGALRALNLYARRFPHPNFEEEANLLRVEAWLASGRRQEARGLAEEMLARDPTSAYAQRLRSLFGEPPAPSEP